MTKKVKKIIELSKSTKKKLEEKAFNSEPRVSLKKYIEDMCDDEAFPKPAGEDFDSKPLTPTNEMRPVEMELDDMEKEAIKPPKNEKPSASKKGYERIGRNLYFNGETYKGIKYVDGKKYEEVFPTEEQAVEFINN